MDILLWPGEGLPGRKFASCVDALALVTLGRCTKAVDSECGMSFAVGGVVSATLDPECAMLIDRKEPTSEAPGSGCVML